MTEHDQGIESPEAARDLTIGEFAVQTGLTQRALRLNAERGILEPVSIDPVTGYRRYSPGQVRTGHLIRALREAAVPMADLVELDAFSIDGHREQLQQQRMLQDQALLLAEAIDGFDAATWPVSVTPAEAQPWAGVRLVEELAEDDEGTETLDALADVELANRCFGVLYAELAARGNRPDGAFWTAMGEGGRPGTVSLTLCWPVPSDPRQGDWAALVEAVRRSLAGRLPGDPAVVAGVLPRRRELSCRTPMLDEQADPATAMMSGMGPTLALQEYETAHGERPVSRTLRQRGVLDDRGHPIGQDWVLDVHA